MLDVRCQAGSSSGPRLASELEEGVQSSSVIAGKYLCFTKEKNETLGQVSQPRCRAGPRGVGLGVALPLLVCGELFSLFVSVSPSVHWEEA